MKIAILGSRGGWHEARLGAALAERGVRPLIVPVTALAARLGAAPRLSTKPGIVAWWTPPAAWRASSFIPTGPRMI